MRVIDDERCGKPRKWVAAIFSISILTAAAQPAVAGNDAFDRRMAMTVQNVVQAQRDCGFEITQAAELLIARDRKFAERPFADDRSIAANLWRETWNCNPDFAGKNCMAARLQLCQRAYGEYGPDGVRAKGFIKAIIKK